VTFVQTYEKSDFVWNLYKRMKPDKFMMWPITNVFGTLNIPPIKTPLWTPINKLEKNVFLYPFQFIYVELNWKQTIWSIKLKYYWEHFGQPHGNMMGTHWEYKKTKNSHPPSFEKKKIGAPWMHGKLFIDCMKLLFSKLFITIFCLGYCQRHKVVIMVTHTITNVTNVWCSMLLKM
jgi:hypothetical protein